MNIDWINTITISISMSADCMTIGASDGMQEPDMKKSKILLIALIFGLFQAVMPTIGYFIGFSFKDSLENYIPWIAFPLLTLLSIKSFIEWVKDFKAEQKKEKEENEQVEDDNATTSKKNKLTIKTLLIQGVATSIDALCLGFVYLDNTIPEALLIFSIIGIVTFSLSFITTLFGKQIGKYIEKWAGLISSIIFLAVGIKTLLQGIL